MPDSPSAPQPPGPGPPADGDGTTATMEMGPQLSTPQCSTPSGLSTVKDDFQFVLCEGCHQEVPTLKLLTCLHTLCLNCLSENKPIGQCPVCRTAIPQASGIPNMDNLLFINLQARLKVYKKIVDGSGPNCCRCRGELAASWCSECEEFLCTKCVEDHQWFFKKRNHEARRVEELRAESAYQFLEDTKKSCNLFCSTPGHASQGHVSSIYCNKCEKALCCICALLDSQHGSFCDIRSETQRRQEELGTMIQELEQKRNNFEVTYSVLQDEAARLEQAQREMRELIREHVEHLVQLIRQEEEELLILVETQQEQGRQELSRELQHVEGVLKRMEASRQLVEKMNHYATEQEVMDMQPFIKKSLEELQQLEPVTARDRTQPGDFAKCRARLQALVDRVTRHPDTNSQAVPTVEVSLENNLQEEPVRPESDTIVPTFTISLSEMHTSPALPTTTWLKRSLHSVEKVTQISPKLLKLECDDIPINIDPSSDQWDDRREPSTSRLSQNCNGIPATRSFATEDVGIIISSSEDSEDDAVAPTKSLDSKKPSSPTWSESGTSRSRSCSPITPASPRDDGSDLSTLVFLSVKIDQKTQQIMELAAVNGDYTFKTLIQTPESVLALFSQGLPMEAGIQNLLWYLSRLPRPILIVYNFWALELPALLKALDTTGRKVDFCHLVGGYVDMLSLIKEKLPRAPSYKLKSLLKRQLQQQLNESSALATAKALQNLWEALELPPQADAGTMLTHCNLQSYTILQPLVQEKLLSRRAVRILAQRNLILWELEKA